MIMFWIIIYIKDIIATRISTTFSLNYDHSVLQIQLLIHHSCIMIRDESRESAYLLNASKPNPPTINTQIIKLIIVIVIPRIIQQTEKLSEMKNWIFVTYAPANDAGKLNNNTNNHHHHGNGNGNGNNPDSGNHGQVVQAEYIRLLRYPPNGMICTILE